VMSTHGRGALGRFWLGSVADDLIRQMPRPVLLVHPPEGKCDLRRPREVKSILVPLDGTPLAEQVIEPAAALGELFEASRTLVRVLAPAIRKAYLPEDSTVRGITHGVLGQLEELQRKAEQEANAYLEGVAAKLSARGLRVQCRVALDENPAAGL